MQRFLQKATAFFDIPLDLRSRVVILIGGLLIIPVLILPLWQIDFASERYPNGLKLVVYSSSLEGGSESDLLEINAMNHYIGMKAIEEETISQFRWMPFLLGIGFIVALRVVVLGKMSRLVDLFFFVSYLGLFSLWSFWSTLRMYASNINPFATIHLEPFSPPLIGSIEVAHVLFTSTPAAGSYIFFLIPLLFVGALCLSRRSWAAEHKPSGDYIG